METWQKLLSQSVVKVEDLPFTPQSEEYQEKLKKVAELYPIRINSYFLEQLYPDHLGRMPDYRQQ